MSFLTHLYEVLSGLLDPWIFMGLSGSWIPQTVTTLIKTRQIDVLLSPSKFQDAWFGNFWGWAGPNVKLGAEKRVIPLLEGRTKGGQIVQYPTGPGIEGVCIEIGAGSGFWVDIFSNKHLDKTATGQESARKKVTRVYGVEPNRDQHVKLRQHIAQAGLEDVYEIVPVGIEDLNDPSKWGSKVEKESVDCIVSILCLCGIPQPQDNLKEIYGYLKKGGRWYVYEHVRADRNWGIRIYQAFVNLFWPNFLGGCQLCRPTEQWLREVGPWAKIDVGQPVDEPWYQVVPHMLGVYTK
ncbi:methyltransferase [Truncatella angustata]|uniref:Methyltransferase n=1 Tax=Truncatella angustata TaxID=152316 RepID=A0A9P8UIR4_9PEZI|nr:methyltransferase [Truncatella angustata]KAH6652975.1 methyltransferase [Truncatella angustata]